MCSIVADTLWRCFGMGAREKFDFCFFFTKEQLLVYDIATDFSTGTIYETMHLFPSGPAGSCLYSLVVACF